MKNLFNRILVPVLFNGDTGSVLKKAIEIANGFECDIHLLHVVSVPRGIPFFHGHFSGTALSNQQLPGYQRRMDELVGQNRALLHDGLLMNSSVIPGAWQSVMKEVIITHHIDLVIIPGQVNKINENILRQVNVDHLAQHTQCPVLTVSPGFGIAHLQNIIVPVNDFLPVRKLTAAAFLARKCNGVVHLVGQRGNDFSGTVPHTTYLTRAYQLLREYTTVKIHCSSQKGATAAGDALEYAKTVQPGLIVVNPGKESLLKGWLNRWLGKYVYGETNIPVLTISPPQ